MAKQLSAIVKEVRQFLRDELSTDAESFKDDELHTHIREALVEVSYAVPHIKKEVVTTIANSRVLDISSITDLIEIEKLEYPVGQDPRDYRNFIKIDDETIEIDCTKTPSAGGSGTLTGTVTFTSGSATVSGSGTAFSTELEAGYLIKKSTGTRWYRVYSIASDTSLTLAEASHDTGADTEDVTQYCYEPVYVYCRKVHTLTEDPAASTLPPQLERVLIDGSVAYAALSWLNKIRIETESALSRVDDVNKAVGNIADRLLQASNYLSDGAAILANSRSNALTAIGNMTARIEQSATDLTAARVIIAAHKRQEALDSLASVSLELGKAVEDLNSGRAQIDDLRDTADTAMDSASARINQAIDDLTAGRSNIGEVPIWGGTEDYSNYALRELNNAQSFLNQGRIYLTQHTTADRYANFGGRDIQLAMAHINEARTYLSLDQPAIEYQADAARELQVANGYLGQARGYLMADDPAKDYALFAGREVGISVGYLNQAGGYIRELNARLSTIRGMTAYQNWANQKLMLFKQDLRKLIKPRTSVRYPKD